MIMQKIFQTLFLILISLLISNFWSCSSFRSRSEKSTAGMAEEDMRIVSGDEQPSPQPSAPAAVTAKSRSVSGKKKLSQKDEAPKREQKKRMVIYFGNLEILVYDLQKSIKEFEVYVKSLGGFSENISVDENNAQITLRVPVSKFDKAMDDLSEKGKLLNREITSSDVTREFTDISTRLENQRAVRERLYKLLSQTKDVKQKMRILREIDRLNKSIEAMALRVKLLSDRANMSTIVANLRLFKSEKQIALPSPFPWIRDLVPERRSITQYDDIKIPSPATFFSDEKNFRKKKSSSLFISPQQTVVRAGYVKNEPQANLTFWIKALDIEMKNRSFEKVKEDPAGKQKNGTVQVYKLTQGLRVSYYAVALFITEKSVFVVETYYPSAKEYDTLQTAVQTSLSETEVSN